LLIGARAVQAIGAGGFMPCASGIVSDEFPEARQRYIGLFTSIFPIGMIVGPNLGGWMVEAFGWRSVFWFNVPLGIVVLVLSRLLLRVDTKKSAAINIDLVGAGLLFSSLTALMISLTELGNNKSGIPWILVGVLFTLGIVLVVFFLRWERRAREPIIDLELLRKRPFLAANAYNLVYGACSLGISSLVPLYAVSIYKMSTLESGIVLTPRSVGVIVASIITSFFLTKWGYRWPIIVGTLTLALGLALLALQPQGIEVMGFHLGPFPLLFIIMGLCGIGAGISSPGSNNACIELMPDKVGTIIGLRGMFRQLGSGIGVAFATVLISRIGDMQRAFYVIMLTSALMFVITIPAIFAMPASANVNAPRNQPAKLESH
jgi:MFS family permease